MSLFVQCSDFEVGNLRIANNNISSDSLQDVIDRVEVWFLQDLLGATLYGQFIADFDGTVFSEQRFTDIFAPFAQDEDCYLIRSEGIKQMLMLMIYFEYVRYQPFTNSETGNNTAVNENSTPASGIASGLYLRYNEAIATYQAIQWFIKENETIYIGYNGQAKEKTSWV